MNQVVHIFEKDVRHLWIEIAISITLVAALVWIGPVEWLFESVPRATAAADQIFRALVSFLFPLILISWLLLVARAVHSEALVGDRQFWITRPYEWKKLMAAKLLFLAAFIYLPFFLMQVILLARAGFSPAHWLPEILLNLVFLSAIILALVAAATVTRNFRSIAVVLLVVAVCLFLIVSASALTGVGSEFSTLPVAAPLASYLIDAIALALACAVIVLQYRMRRTELAWIVLMAIPAAFLLIQFIAPDHLVINQKYPLTTEESNAPVQLAFVDRSGDRSLAGHEEGGPNIGKLITVKIPVQLSGIAQGSAVVFNQAKISLEAANGRQWSSNWQGQVRWVLRPENDEWEAEMIVPTQSFDKFEGFPVNVRLDVALTEVKAGSMTQIAMPKPRKEIAVPGFGICVPQAGDFPDAVNLSCRFAWRPPFTYVTARWFTEPCAAAKEANDPGIEGDGWVGSVDRTEAWMFFPVVAPYIHLSNSASYERGRADLRYLCPSTPATFTHYEPVRSVQESLTIPNLRLWTVGREN
jgi:hypothetical protein